MSKTEQKEQQTAQPELVAEDENLCTDEPLEAPSGTEDPLEDAAEQDGEEVDLAAAAAELAAAYAALEKENTELKRFKEEFEASQGEAEQKILRLSADFDNFRRRTVTEKEQWRQQIVADFAADMLPILDNFRLALQMMQKDEAAKNHTTGVDMIYRQLFAALQGKGLEQIPAVGELFDPKWHEAVSQEKVEDEAQDNLVLEELQPGYRIGDRLIRAAMVKVGKY